MISSPIVGTFHNNRKELTNQQRKNRNIYGTTILDEIDLFYFRNLEMNNRIGT